MDDGKHDDDNDGDDDDDDEDDDQEEEEDDDDDDDEINNEQDRAENYRRERKGKSGYRRHIGSTQRVGRGVQWSLLALLHSAIEVR